jgi:hypothetical protein
MLKNLNGKHKLSSRRIKFGKWIFGMVLAGLAAILLDGLWLGQPPHHYLYLQSISDPIHRLAVLSLPFSFFSWLLIRILNTQKKRWPRTAHFARLLSGWILFYFVGLVVFVLRFDQRIEQSGSAGLLKVFPFNTPSLSPALRFLREKLDLQALTGPWNNQQQIAPPWVILRGQNPHYDDDAMLVAYHRNTGDLLWEFHCLGNRISPISTDGSHLLWASWRPSTNVVYLMDTRTPKILWTRQLEEPLALPPLLQHQRVALAHKHHIHLLDLTKGSTLIRRLACTQKDDPMVVCQDQQVIAWK